MNDLILPGGPAEALRQIQTYFPNPNKSEPKRFKRKSITIDIADKAIGRISFWKYPFHRKEN